MDVDFTLPTGAASEIAFERTAKLTGEILWLVDKGRVQRFREEVSLDAPLQIEIERLSSTSGFVFKNVEQAECLPSKN